MKLSIKSVEPSRYNGQNFPLVSFDISKLPEGLQISRGTGRLSDRGLDFKTFTFDGGYSEECEAWYEAHIVDSKSMEGFSPSGNDYLADWRIPFKFINQSEDEGQWYYCVHPVHRIIGGQTVLVSACGLTPTTDNLNLGIMGNYSYFGGECFYPNLYADYSTRFQALIVGVDGDDLYIGWGYIGFTESNNRLTIPQLFCLNDIGTIDFTTTDEEYGEESTEGGYSVGGNPSFDDSSDSILIPSDPSISVSNLGFLNTYKVSTSGLTGMIEELFPEELLPIIPDPSGEGFLSDVAHSVNALASTLGNVFTSFVNSNLLQYVVDVHVVPVEPNSVGTERIKVGFKTLDSTALKVEHDYVNVSCGSLHIPEYYKNFLDYQSKCSLFVPFVGLVPVNPDMFLGGSISVDFKFNIIDGSFTAFVSCKSSKSKLNGVCGQYSGNCCVHIPITSNSYSNIVSGLVTAVGHGENMVTSKSLSSGSMASGIDAMANIESKPMYNMSNGFNATSGFMGVRIPYLIISRPVSSFSKAYPHEKGMPLNVTKKLSELVGSGMTVCDKPHIDFECTEWERQEIEKLLTSGVIL